MSYKYLFLFIFTISFELCAMEQQLICKHPSDPNYQKMAETVENYVWGGEHPLLQKQLLADLSQAQNGKQNDALAALRENVISILAQKDKKGLNKSEELSLRQYALHIVMGNNLQQQKSLDRLKNNAIRYTFAAGGAGLLFGMYLCRSYMCTY